MNRPIIDDPFDTRDRIVNDENPIWISVGVAMAIALLLNNLRVIYFPEQDRVWFDGRLSLNNLVWIVIYVIGTMLHMELLYRKSREIKLSAAVRNSFYSVVLAVVVFKSVQFFAYYSLEGVWQSALKLMIIMGLLCTNIANTYMSVRQKRTWLPAVGLLVGLLVVFYIIIVVKPTFML